MRSSAEFSVDFSTEELLQDASDAKVDAGSATPLQTAAQYASRPPPVPASIAPEEDCVEIELTAEQIDALLSSGS